jgi:hypothetical protein
MVSPSRWSPVRLALVVGALAGGFGCMTDDRLLDAYDRDGDGYYPAEAAPSGATAPWDCAWDDAEVHPGADERCDGVDNDCDGAIDDEPVDGEAWYPDGDNDGTASAQGSIAACDRPAGFLAQDAIGDCDDNDQDVHPGADESCNGIDDDCDGGTDVGAVDGTPWFADGDTDGYGAGPSTLACDPPNGAVADSGDCDDDDATVHPAATEVCNGVDDDCVGDADVGAVDATSWYLDDDNDSFGTGDGLIACDAPRHRRRGRRLRRRRGLDPSRSHRALQRRRRRLRRQHGHRRGRRQHVVRRHRR